ncbi:UdgX family uracil-DNA binding protein [Entomobacter blattae]|uniref:Type-4 uracil-DNA glycosylase n=1 Tax=Entomobacter blattae TaxID=2762277 RepID=A0A7H1NP91_9PROT|nr:UdgX family uracil-DNA binding protein [Entomobacter blattae]QNT77601.1 Uracil DNA glycosylase superfamily protein [Entomobacter blattae]
MTYVFTIPHPYAWTYWKSLAKNLIERRIPPEEVTWRIGPTNEDVTNFSVNPSQGFTVPRSLYDTLQAVMQSAEDCRLSLLYELLWRHTQHITLFDIKLDDPFIKKALELANTVENETFTLRRSLLFHTVAYRSKEVYLGWSPFSSYIIPPNHAYFSSQLNQASWAIFSPSAACYTTNDEIFVLKPPLTFINKPPTTKELADMWAYVCSLPTTQKEVSDQPINLYSFSKANPPFPMPVSQLHSSSLTKKTIEPLVTTPYPTWEKLKEQALSCQRCQLCYNTQKTVFGEGNTQAPLMLVGEQPGDQEDIEGRPFVGPAGKVLTQAIKHAGFERENIYLTNAVKHFKFKQIPNRRLHVTPNDEEIHACSLWLEAEKALIQPKVVLMLGGSAAKALLKRPVSVLKERSNPFTLSPEIIGLITVHPSYLLRMEDNKDRKREAYFKFVEDIKQAYQLAVTKN